MFSLDARMHNLWLTISRLQISNSGNTVQSSLHKHHSTFSVSLNQKQIQHLLLQRDPEANYRLMTEAQQGLSRGQPRSQCYHVQVKERPHLTDLLPRRRERPGETSPQRRSQRRHCRWQNTGLQTPATKEQPDCTPGHSSSFVYFLFPSLLPSFQFCSAQYFSSISQFTFILEYLRMLIK